MNTAEDINIVIIEFFAAGAYIHRIVMGSGNYIFSRAGVLDRDRLGRSRRDIREVVPVLHHIDNLCIVCPIRRPGGARGVCIRERDCAPVGKGNVHSIRFIVLDDPLRILLA
jgi:hypothetical protein